MEQLALFLETHNQLISWFFSFFFMFGVGGLPYSGDQQYTE